MPFATFCEVEQLGIGAGSRCAGPRCAMVSQFQNRGPGQGAAHQHTKEVAARGMAIAGGNVMNVIVRKGVLKWMRVILRMRVAV